MRILLLALCFVLCACGPARQQGDADGQPVAFQVHVTKDFTSELETRSRGRVGVGYAASSSGARSSGFGLGLTFSSTSLTLEAEDPNSEALIFRQRLRWGDNSFTIPLRQERELVLSLVVESNSYAREKLGKVRAADAQPITITLDKNGSSLK